MTEDKAKTKWCPMARVGLVDGMSVNRHPAEWQHKTIVYDDTRCLGSGVMMWRCEQTSKSDGKGGYLAESMPANEWTGYCSLSRQP